uniref:Uncharacterized protein n=1 Tax=Aegilops tauschii subsp. strangulata TaxID=200361 RepID=A0A452YCK4_AEGTS
PFPVLQGVQVLRAPHKQKNDVAKQLKRREGIMVTTGRNGAKHADLCKKATNQYMREFNY